MIRYIDPLARLGKRLLEVEKPARYIGGEYGRLAKPGAVLQTAVVFPDLYELGMSNQAFRILYNTLNRIDDISCDRAFAPAPDFEKLLEEEGVPLYGLDTGIPLGDTDMLLFSLGYELGINGILSVLDRSRVPFRAAQRGRGDPMVIIGGPCVSNPLPYSPFADAFWIGEAEAGFFDLCKVILGLKKSGASRGDMLDRILSHPHVWGPGKTRASRAVAADFGRRPQGAVVFPVSSIRTVQHHGAVEIMRGCPNGCRFCHAGIWYRPMRQKPADLVVQEVEELVSAGGYREISLSSLSSGDYCYITELAGYLNSLYASRHVSFQLPSLRVSGFSLPLLSRISEVRKSGLTFAVETPLEMWQLGINKTVKLDEIVSILEEAKRRGWRGAKFYFMIGLPPANRDSALGTDREAEDGRRGGREERAIVDFIAEAGKRSRGHFHINVGVFVPKPHTPFERAPQLGEDQAWPKLNHIISALKPLGHKVSVHDPFVSMVEGLIARGDERVGGLIEEAFAAGARLDPWSEYFRRDIWQGLFEKNPGLVSSALAEKTGTLPWRIIEPGAAGTFLAAEKRRSEIPELSAACMENCTHPCGVCNAPPQIVKNSIHYEVKIDKEPENSEKNPALWRILFSFSKKGAAIFIPHLGVIEVFSMALLRSGLQPVFTQGFNPHVRLDFASPAALGLVCEDEAACVDFKQYLEPETFILRLNPALPPGFSVARAEIFNIPRGAKKYPLPPLLYGFTYTGPEDALEHCIRASEEKEFRLNHKAGRSFPVRSRVLAHNPEFAKTGEAPAPGTAAPFSAAPFPSAPFPSAPFSAKLLPYTGYFEAYRALMNRPVSC
ncbi:MAG: TIGR03936 family radical SAM-associated protein [Spirochaetaceae bacterium]|jgi:radical SAM-linked protein|nr:TIGR03936 family radical SAM-associated protein [Spirochaetaceae bacterium]